MILEEIYTQVVNQKLFSEDKDNDLTVQPVSPKGEKPRYESPDDRVKKVGTILNKIVEDYLQVLELTEQINQEIEKIKEPLARIKELEKKQQDLLNRIKDWGIKVGKYVLSLIEKAGGKQTSVVEAIKEQQNTFVILSNAVKARLEELQKVQEALGLSEETPGREKIAQAAIGVKIGAQRGKIELGDVDEIVRKATKLLKLTKEQKEQLAELLDEYTEKNASLKASIELILISGQAIDNITEALEKTGLDVRKLKDINIKSYTIATKSSKIENLKSQEESLDFTPFFEILAENAEINQRDYYEELYEAIEANLNYLLVESDRLPTNIVALYQRGVKTIKSFLDGLRLFLDNLANLWSKVVLELASLIGLRAKVSDLKKADALAADEFIALLETIKSK